MIKAGADVNIAGKNGLSPLHVASHYNHPAMVTLLLTSKASPHSMAKVISKASPHSMTKIISKASPHSMAKVIKVTLRRILTYTFFGLS